MALSKLTKITGPGVSTDTNWVGNNANFTGITTTATSFNIGVTTIHSTLIESHNIKSTGIITATGGSFSGNVTAVDGTFSGNVSIAGTLSYEDITNIDSVGIITAQKDIHVGAGVSAVGVGTFGSLDISGDIDVDGHTNLDNLSIAGVTTIANDTEFKIGSNANNKLPFKIKQDTGGGNINYLDSRFTYFRSHAIRMYDQDNTSHQVAYFWNNQIGLYASNVETLRVAGSGVNILNGDLTVGRDIDVDGHTNLDNVSIAGVTTFTGHIETNSDVYIPDRLIHAGDANTQIRFPAADTVTIETAGSERLRIDSNGKLIATQSASNIGLELHATGSGRGSQTKYHNDHGEAYVGQAGDTTGNLLIHNTSNTNMLFSTNNVERVRINSDGKIGIATDTGNGLINTRHGGTNQQVLHFRSDLGTSNNRTFNLYTPDTDNSMAPFRFQTGNGYLFQCDNENVFTIAHDRRVGIMSATPTEALEVRGNIFCRGATTSDKPRIKFGFTNGVIQGGKTEGNVGEDYLAISADGGTTDHFVVDYGGNVGISSINPRRPLDVRGEVFANRFTANSAPTSTYNNQTTGVKYGARGGYTLTLGGSRSSNTNSFTIFEAKDFNNSKYFCLEISFCHAGGGIHGSYRRFAGICNGYTTITTWNDTGNVNVGGGLGFTISKPDTHTLRCVWNGCSGFADSYTLYCKLDVSNGNSYFSAIDSAFY